jgi:hypothetical protein
MFDKEKLKVGDVFYTVRMQNNFFNRKKIHREIDGEDWFKYEKTLQSYQIATYTVIGILRKELEGDWSSGNSCKLDTSFLIEDESGTRKTEYFYNDDDKYFLDKEDAIKYKSELEAEAQEDNRK